MNEIALPVIDRLVGGRIGTFDRPCPLCGPTKQKLTSQRKPVLRIWRDFADFATYHCARCGAGGYIRDGNAIAPDAAALVRARAEAAKRERRASAERLSKARWLWSQRRPIAGSIAERYLRVRSIAGPLPATLAFLAGRGEHAPAMIAAFGIPDEPEPGKLIIAADAVRGVHLTRLASDGSGKAGTDNDKIMVGMSSGWPIVLAAANDLDGLTICEGIEDALSLHIVSGLGAWAAGSASRLPALANAILPHMAVTVFSDDDDAGRQNAGELVRLLSDRHVDVRLRLASVKATA